MTGRNAHPVTTEHDRRAVKSLGLILSDLASTQARRNVRVLVLLRELLALMTNPDAHERLPVDGELVLIGDHDAEQRFFATYRG